MFQLNRAKGVMKVTPLFLIGILFFHFYCTLIYVMPTTPLKAHLASTIEYLPATIFSQNWSLFAPNPVSSDYIMLLKPLRDSIQVELKEDTTWYNISSPFWRRYKDRRFSAYDRFARLPSNSIRTYLNGEIWMVDLAKGCSQGDSSLCNAYRIAMDESQKKQKEVISLIISSFCNGNIDKTYQYAAVRIRVTQYPNWKRRDLDKPASADIDVGIFKIEKSVFPLKIVE